VCETVDRPGCAGSTDRQYADPGEYLIFHDGADVGPLGGLVEVIGTKGDLSFRADYIFEEGTCHVNKVRGPDQVVLSR
jgi:hypothetical protein